MLVWTGRLSCGVLVFSGRTHILIDGYRVLFHTIMLLYRIKHLSLSYDIFQPASHYILMDTKDVWDMPGTTCACVDALGRHGRSNFPVSVDCSVLPYGKCMTSAVWACRTVLRGVIMLLYRIKHLSLSYDIFQPASHYILMDTKDVWDMPGTTCACVDALGRHGRSNFPVSVDCSVLPYGKCMTSAVWACRTVLRGV